MAGKRTYGYTTIFGVRAVNIKHLWEPSTEYLGKPTTKPNYLGTFVLAKSRAAWWEEPAFAGVVAACMEVCKGSNLDPSYVVEWPLKDGDLPPEPGKSPADWAKAHWVFSGNSDNRPNVTIAQNGAAVPLPSRAMVKPGDFCAVGVACAVKQNNARGIKFYLNTVLFMGAGEEIAVGNSVTGAELMRQAQAQGLQVAGFGSGPGGFAGPSQGGFPGPGAPQGPGGFGGPAGPGAGFTHGNGGGFAPTQGNPASPGFASNPNGGPGGGFAYHSNPGFTTPPGGQPGAVHSGGSVAQGAPGHGQTGPATFPSNPGPQQGGFPGPQTGPQGGFPGGGFPQR